MSTHPKISRATATQHHTLVGVIQINSPPQVRLQPGHGQLEYRGVESVAVWTHVLWDNALGQKTFSGSPAAMLGERTRTCAAFVKLST